MRDEIRRGMKTHLRALEDALELGDTRAGWKIGFNDPAIQARLGLDTAVVGHLVGSRVLESGATCCLPAGAAGRVEVEVAIELERDVPASADLDSARQAIGRLLPALEVVDFSRSFDGLETILGHDIFHEAVVFGAVGSGRAGASLEGVEAVATKNGERVAQGDLGLVPADLAEVVQHVADSLGAVGEHLRTGERIISGSLVKPIEVAPGDTISADLGPLGKVEVRFA